MSLPSITCSKCALPVQPLPGFSACENCYLDEIANARLGYALLHCHNTKLHFSLPDDDPISNVSIGDALKNGGELSTLRTIVCALSVRDDTDHEMRRDWRSDVFNPAMHFLKLSPDYNPIRVVQGIPLARGYLYIGRWVYEAADKNFQRLEEVLEASENGGRDPSDATGNRVLTKGVIMMEKATLQGKDEMFDRIKDRVAHARALFYNTDVMSQDTLVFLASNHFTSQVPFFEFSVSDYEG